MGRPLFYFFFLCLSKRFFKESVSGAVSPMVVPNAFSASFWARERPVGTWTLTVTY